MGHNHIGTELIFRCNWARVLTQLGQSSQKGFRSFLGFRQVPLVPFTRDSSPESHKSRRSRAATPRSDKEIWTMTTSLARLCAAVALAGLTISLLPVSAESRPHSGAQASKQVSTSYKYRNVKQVRNVTRVRDVTRTR